MIDESQTLTSLLVAAAVGAIVGLERQTHRKESEPYAGVRTFAFYAVWGALAGLLGDEYGSEAFAVALGAFGALIVASYVVSSLRSDDWGMTTEAAALVVFGAGALAWDEEYLVSAAIAIGAAALLESKEVLRRWAERFSHDDVQALLQFGVITAVVLPLVPDEEVAVVGGVNPRQIWLMVVLASAISLTGYLALRFFGERGIELTGVLGGLASSTAVTLGFSRLSRHQPGLEVALAAGILLAAAVMYARVLVEAAVVEPELARRLAAPIVVLIVIEAIAVYWSLRGGLWGVSHDHVEIENPLSLAAALQFGALFGTVLVVSEALLDRAPDSTLYAVGALAGLTDVDAITLSTANLVDDGLDANVGAAAVAVAVVSNTVTKGLIAVALGSPALRRSVTFGLAPSAAAGAAFALAFALL